MTEVKIGDTLYEIINVGFNVYTVAKVTVVGVGKLQIHVAGRTRIKSKHGRDQIDDTSKMWCRLFSTPIAALREAFALNEKNLEKINRQQEEITNTIKGLP